MTAALREVFRFRRREMRTAALDHVPVGKRAHDFGLRVFFDVVHFPGGEKFAVGQRLEAVVIATNAGEAFDVRIPRGEFVVGDRPLAEAIARGAFKIEPAPTLRLPRPDQGLAADLVTANPVVGFFLFVGVFGVFDEKMRRRLIEGVAFFGDGIRGDDVAGQLAAMREIPRVFQGRGIIVAVFHVAAALEDERAQAAFTEFLRRPTAADARADDDSVKRMLAGASGGRVIRHRR